MLPTIFGSAVAGLGSRLLSGSSQLKIFVVHAIPGRLRLRCQAWKNTQVAEMLERVFANESLVKAVTASPITGSLLLEFHQPHLTQEQFDQMMNSALEASVEGFKVKEADLMGLMRKGINKTDHLIRTRTFGIVDSSSLISLALIISGFAGVIGNNQGSGYRNLLWAYRMIRGEEARRR